MTVFYPDIASYQAGIDLSGALIVSAKATEGTIYFNPYYLAFKEEAGKHGTYFTAYHFLSHSNATAQAEFAYNYVSKIPLMLDFEPAGTKPTLDDAIAFIDRYRAKGGITYLLYLPEWYWVQLGRPSLKPFVDRGMLLVSSNYSAYTDSNTGAGWQAYGGMTPTIWQYTSTMAFGGKSNVDFNAFRGSKYAGKQDTASVAATIAEFKSLASTGKLQADPPKPIVNDPPVLRIGANGTAVRELQTRLNLWGARLAVDGDFGPATNVAVRAFQREHGLVVDGIVGPITWAALVKTPPPWTYGPPRNLSARGGHTSVLLSWSLPANAPTAPDHYKVYVYAGTRCNRDTLVASYPRTAKVSPYQGGSLRRGQLYTAHVLAEGPNGSHVKSDVYASVAFRTG